jgi:hypothetical protein
MSCQLGINSIFGANNYIKFLNSDIVAIEGPNTLERLIAGDIRIPYKQVLKGRIILRAGQTNYLMNHLGLGDNATFVAIIARYDSKSVNEEDNYVEYYYFDDAGTIRYMDQVMILTGNSTHRIPQIYFNNPNTRYTVQLDVMVAVIDDTYTFFDDTTNQSGLSFYNLQCNSTINCVETFITGEKIVIYDTNTPTRNALAYITLQGITSMNINNDLIVIDEQTLGKVFLQFITVYDAKQAFSLINYLMENSTISVTGPDVDSVPPIVYFNTYVNNNPTYGYISMGGATAGAPYNTGASSSLGLTFSAGIPLSLGDPYYSSYVLTKSDLYGLLIDGVSDNRDGDITLDDADIILENYSSVAISSITTTGTYSMYFNVTDLAGNSIDTGTYVTLIIT